MVKSQAGFKLETIMRGNKPAKYATVTIITVKELNRKPILVLRVRAAPQDTRKNTIAAAKATIPNVLSNKSV